MQSGLAVQCTTLKVSLNIAVASWLSLSQEAQAVQRQTVAIFEQLHAAGVAGSVTYLSHPADFTGSVKAQPSFTSTACTLKVRPLTGWHASRVRDAASTTSSTPPPAACGFRTSDAGLLAHFSMLAVTCSRRRCNPRLRSHRQRSKLQRRW